MGRKEGNGVKYHDEAHRKQRIAQRKYDRAIAKIRKEKKCSFFEAQRIHRKRRLTEELKKLEREEKK